MFTICWSPAREPSTHTCIFRRHSASRNAHLTSHFAFSFATSSLTLPPTCAANASCEHRGRLNVASNSWASRNLIRRCSSPFVPSVDRCSRSSFPQYGHSCDIVFFVFTLPSRNTLQFSNSHTGDIMDSRNRKKRLSPIFFLSMHYLLHTYIHRYVQLSRRTRSRRPSRSPASPACPPATPPTPATTR